MKMINQQLEYNQYNDAVIEYKIHGPAVYCILQELYTLANR